MTRSTYKLPYIARSLKKSGYFLGKGSLRSVFPLTNGLFGPLAELPKLTTSARKPVQNSPTLVYQRSSTIVPGMIGNTVKIHTGHKFVKLSITEHTVGYKFGEFAPTKKRALYKKKKKR